MMNNDEREKNRVPTHSLFDLAYLPRRDDLELCEVLACGKTCHIERIVSTGQITSQGEWYDQDQDEWVALLSGNAELMWADGTTTALSPGDWLLIPAHERHRVTYTSEQPPCVWLAFFFSPEAGLSGAILH